MAGFKHLTPEQKQFVNDKTVSTTMKIGKWLAFLYRVSQFDKKNDATISRLGGFGTASLVLAFLSIIVVFISETYEIALVTIVLVILGILMFTYQKSLKSKDVNNYMRLFFLPVLQVLKAKSGEDAKLSATLDFRDPRKALTPKLEKINERNLKLYTPKYIVARVTLKDASALEFLVMDDIKDFSWKKRSASGKIKYKSKSKFVHHCYVKMTLSKEEYTWKGGAVDVVSVEELDDKYIAKVKVKEKTEGKDNVLKVNAFFGAMQSIYEQFEPKNPVQEKAQEGEPKEGVVREADYDDGADMMLLPYVWYGSQFDQYDYDSVEYMESGDYAMDDDSVTAFDS